MTLIQRLRSLAFRLNANTSGLALLEFAFGAPLVLSMGLYGIELSNLALANLRVSQIALNLADNAARVGLMNSLNIEQLREVDVNDVLAAAKTQGAPWQLTTRGRITLSSLEADASGSIQTIHWQRCIGLKSGANYDSTYGKTLSNSTGGTPVAADGSSGVYDTAAGVDTDSSATDNSASHPGSPIAGGMGDAAAKVLAPASSGVMFVEVNYDYLPVVSSLWLPGGAQRIHYIASFLVRDRRDFTEIYNPTPTATASTCDLHTQGVGGSAT